MRVVAPDVEQSSASHAITSSRPLRYRRTDIFDGIEAYRVNGTPADCVALGIYHWDHVDVVLSGVNLGPNLGNATWHSGTLAAAKQAVLLGVRGIAFSAPIDEETSDLSLSGALGGAHADDAVAERTPDPRERQLPVASRKACAGRRRRSTATTGPSFPRRIRWDASSSGSRSCRSNGRPRERISGRSRTGT